MRRWKVRIDFYPPSEWFSPWTWPEIELKSGWIWIDLVFAVIYAHVVDR